MRSPLSVTSVVLQLTLLLAPSPAVATATAHEWVTREAVLMGAPLQIAVAAASRSDGIAAIERAFDAVRAVESRLTTWRPDGELMQLNRAEPGVPVALSPDLRRDLQLARHWWKATGGAFDPAIGALIDAWDLRGAGRHPSPPALAAALRATGFARVRMDTIGGTAARLDEGLWLDSGAFGKGIALAAARDALAASGIADGWLDFGGQIVTLGAPSEAADWTVPVAHPARRDSAEGTLRLASGSSWSVATSAQSERSVDARAGRIGHILDPRTGLPVDAWGSVTVVTSDPATADILSTALFVLGPDDGIAWAARHPAVAALFLVHVDGAVSVRCTRAMQVLYVPSKHFDREIVCGER